MEGKQMRNWLKNKYVVLSGASGGIGRELCKILIETYGANVIGIGRNQDKMLSLKTELGDNADKFSYYLFDVAQKENWVPLREDLKTKNLAIALLINNAGMFPIFQKTENTSPDTIQRIMETNFLSVTYAIENLSPVLKGDEKHKPDIVNVCSSAALCTIAGTSAYSASKAALKAYTEALQLETKDKYIGIVYPGTTATDLFRNDEHTKNSALDIIAMPAQKMAKKIARKILKKRKRAVVGWDAKLMNLIAKFMPVKGTALIAWVMKISKSKVFEEVFDYKKKK
jgi:short-subunit dehydrogenase